MTPADMREAAAQAIEDEAHEHPGSEFHYSIAAGVVRAIPIPTPAVPGIDLAAIEARARECIAESAPETCDCGECVASRDLLALCRALRDMTAERDALRGAGEDARGHLNAWSRTPGMAIEEGCAALDVLNAALASAGQEQAEPVPTPEDPSENEQTDALACINCGWHGASNIDHDAYKWSPEGDLLCPECGYACGASAPVPAERARRGTP